VIYSRYSLQNDNVFLYVKSEWRKVSFNEKQCEYHMCLGVDRVPRSVKGLGLGLAG
jgi:hypothetical protein